MIDALLYAAILSAEADERMELEVTLLVGGFLVSGFIVSKKKFEEHHFFAKTISDEFSKLEMEQPLQSEEKPGQGDRNFIHLRDAKYYTPGGPPIPANKGVYCRIKADSIAGFSFGLLSAGP